MLLQFPLFSQPRGGLVWLNIHLVVGGLNSMCVWWRKVKFNAISVRPSEGEWMLNNCICFFRSLPFTTFPFPFPFHPSVLLIKTFYILLLYWCSSLSEDDEHYTRSFRTYLSTYTSFRSLCVVAVQSPCIMAMNESRHYINHYHNQNKGKKGKFNELFRTRIPYKPLYNLWFFLIFPFNLKLLVNWASSFYVDNISFILLPFSFSCCLPHINTPCCKKNMERKWTKGQTEEITRRRKLSWAPNIVRIIELYIK